MITRRAVTREEERLAEKIKAVWESRKTELGLTQISACKQLGIKQGAFSQFVNGVIPMPDNILINLSVLLDYPLHKFSPSFSKKLDHLIKIDFKEVTMAVLHSIDSSPHPKSITVETPKNWNANTYAVFVDSDKLEPYASATQFLLVAPLARVANNSKVFINTHTDGNYVGKLVSKTPTWIQIADIITGHVTTIPEPNVNTCHLIKGVISQ